MKDKDKIQDQLIHELLETRKRITELVTSETQLKQAEEDRERLILKLRDALNKVKILSGLLPICASCKKIRDDKGYWKQIETYIQDHSEAEFSHGLCPECVKKLYPDFHREI